jgi:hypothetical protein
MNGKLHFNGKGFFPPRDGEIDPSAYRVQFSREGMRSLAIKLSWLMMMENNPVDDDSMERQVTNILCIVEQAIGKSENVDIGIRDMPPPSISPADILPPY